MKKNTSSQRNHITFFFCVRSHDSLEQKKDGFTLISILSSTKDRLRCRSVCPHLSQNFVENARLFSLANYKTLRCKLRKDEMSGKFRDTGLPFAFSKLNKSRVC